MNSFREYFASLISEPTLRLHSCVLQARASSVLTSKARDPTPSNEAFLSPYKFYKSSLPLLPPSHIPTFPFRFALFSGPVHGIFINGTFSLLQSFPVSRFFSAGIFPVLPPFRPSLVSSFPLAFPKLLQPTNHAKAHA